MSRHIRQQLSLMMFLQYAITGLVLPILSLYLLEGLHFSAVQAGWIMAMPALAAILSPFALMVAADRFVSTRRLLSLCHVGAGTIMLLVSMQTQFWPFLLLYFCYGLLFIPTFALTNSVSFQHLDDPQRDFGRIRLWGPVSWVVVAFGFSFFWLRQAPPGEATARLQHALVLAAFASYAVALQTLWMPPGNSPATDRKAPPWQALQVFRRKGIAVLGAVTFLNALVHQVYYFGMGPYLQQRGLAEEWIMPVMSMGQGGEVFVLAGLGVLLSRLGFKGALLLGLAAQALRSLVYAVAPLPLSIAVIPIHGVCYATFFAVAYIYVDTHSSLRQRAGAQLLFNMLIMGFGNLCGNLFAGAIADAFREPGGAIDFASYWWVSTILSTVLVAALAIGFRTAPAVSEEQRLHEAA